jgi:hypothetical protein
LLQPFTMVDGSSNFQKLLDTNQAEHRVLLPLIITRHDNLPSLFSTNRSLEHCRCPFPALFV